MAFKRFGWEPFLATDLIERRKRPFDLKEIDHRTLGKLAEAAEQEHLWRVFAKQYAAPALEGHTRSR